MGVMLRGFIAVSAGGFGGAEVVTNPPLTPVFYRWGRGCMCPPPEKNQKFIQGRCWSPGGVYGAATAWGSGGVREPVPGSECRRGGRKGNRRLPPLSGGFGFLRPGPRWGERGGRKENSERKEKQRNEREKGITLAERKRGKWRKESGEKERGEKRKEEERKGRRAEKRKEKQRKEGKRKVKKEKKEPQTNQKKSEKKKAEKRKAKKKKKGKRKQRRNKESKKRKRAKRLKKNRAKKKVKKKSSWGKK